MKKIVFGAASALCCLAVLTGCSSVVATKVDKNVQYVVQFSGNDFNVGEVVTAEMPYDEKNLTLTEMLLNKAITENKCDTILLPRYEVISKGFGKKIIKITGRAATFKTK